MSKQRGDGESKCPVSISSMGVHLLKDSLKLESEIIVIIMTNSMLKACLCLQLVINLLYLAFSQQNINVICCLSQIDHTDTVSN